MIRIMRTREGMAQEFVRTAISSASARGIGLVMWSPYITPTLWVGVKRDAY